MSETKVPVPKKIRKPRGKVRLLPGKCIACGRCPGECP
ncbi:MAG: hypothetical protein H6Q43_1967, partial [Deltaproteobacteria bacterium]|nr:hypothetical protein [Deltaproteobacteria bacterium]